MNIILLDGGLGNQMSQYAFFVAKKMRHRSVVSSYFLKRYSAHWGYELERAFGIADNANLFVDAIVRYARKLLYCKDNRGEKYLVRPILFLSKCLGFNLILENENYRYDSDLLERHRGINVYVGGWTTEKYFKDIELYIRRAFSFNLNNLNERTLSLLRRIDTCSSVSIHIRRGDFLLLSNIETLGKVCSLDYVHRAVDYIKNIVDSPVFFIFSDDQEWVKANLYLNDMVFVDWNTGYDSWQDMCLISRCKHNVNANSTFSWWGAWLNSNPQKIVIVPRYFIYNRETPDVSPEQWVKL
jgi:hypothetical protein